MKPNLLKTSLGCGRKVRAGDFTIKDAKGNEHSLGSHNDQNKCPTPFLSIHYNIKMCIPLFCNSSITKFISL